MVTSFVSRIQASRIPPVLSLVVSSRTGSVPSDSRLPILKSSLQMRSICKDEDDAYCGGNSGNKVGYNNLRSEVEFGNTARNVDLRKDKL